MLVIASTLLGGRILPDKGPDRKASLIEKI
jgi:hypothetical protein